MNIFFTHAVSHISGIVIASSEGLLCVLHLDSLANLTSMAVSKGAFPQIRRSLSVILGEVDCVFIKVRGLVFLL